MSKARAKGKKAGRRRSKGSRGPPGDGEDRRERILSAADALFCAHGYAGVSMRDVAEAADVNKALIFYYFASKDALFDTVLEGYYRAHAQALAGAAGEGPLGERVHRLVDAYLDFIDANRRYPRLIQQEIVRGAQVSRIRESMAGLFASIAETLGDALPAQGPLSPKHFFLTLSGATINFYTYAPVLGSLWGEDPMGAEARAERRAHVHWLVDTLLAGLTREGPQPG